MPEIPRFTRRQGIAAGPLRARADAAAFGGFEAQGASLAAASRSRIARAAAVVGRDAIRSAEAAGEVAAGVARAAGRFFETAETTLIGFAERREEARRAADLVRLNGQAARELAALELSFQRDTDFRTAPERFDAAAAEIRARLAADTEDGAVRRLFTRDFDKLALTKSVAISGLAFKRETEATVAELDSLLPEYARQASAASSRVERAELIRRGRAAIADLAAGGFIPETDAVARERAFLGAVDEADVRRLITGAPELAVAALGDPQQLPNLDPVQRARLLDTASARAEAEARERTAAAERAERRAERDERRAQEARTGELLVGVQEGAVDLAGITEALRLRQITPTQFGVLRNAIDNRDRPASDDPAELARVMDLVFDRDPNARTALREAEAAGLIRGETRRTLESKVDSLENGIETDLAALDRRNLDAIDAEVGGGALINLTGENHVRASRARQEYFRRVEAGEDRDAAREAAIGHWSVRTEGPATMAAPRDLAGTRQAPDEAATRRAIDAKLADGSYTPAEAAAELRLLEALIAAVEARARRSPVRERE